MGLRSYTKFPCQSQKPSELVFYWTGEWDIFSNTSSAELKLPNWRSLPFTLLPRMEAVSLLICFPSISLLCFHLSSRSGLLFSFLFPPFSSARPPAESMSRSSSQTDWENWSVRTWPHWLRLQFIELLKHATVVAMQPSCFFLSACLPRSTQWSHGDKTGSVHWHTVKKNNRLLKWRQTWGFGRVRMACIGLEARFSS